MRKLFTICALIATASALKCWTLQRDNNDYSSQSVRDLGLVTCKDPAHKTCIYIASTGYLPSGIHPYPVHYETTGCSNGRTIQNAKASSKYHGLPDEDICKHSAKGKKWDFTVAREDGVMFNTTERLDEVYCCRSDGCNKEHYKLVGGGYVAPPAELIAPWWWSEFILGPYDHNKKA